MLKIIKSNALVYEVKNKFRNISNLCSINKSKKPTVIMVSDKFFEL
jgi:hypothetical protein